MKTSNYILITYFALLFVGIFVLFLAAKSDHNNWENTILETMEQPLGSFSVVAAQPNAQIKLSKGEASKIMKLYTKGTTGKLPAFKVRNDTLFVGPDPAEDQIHTTEITYQKIDGVLGEENSQINLAQFGTDTFNITLRAGKMFCYSDQSKNVPNNLTINATQGSYLQINSYKINHLNLLLDHSELNIQNSNIDQLSGTIKNDSKLMNYAAIYKFNLEVDATSTYYINKR